MGIDGSAASDAAAATGSNWQQKLATSAANLARLLCQFDSVAGQAVKTASESSRVKSRRVMFQQMQIAHTTRWQHQRLRCNCNIDWGSDANQLVSCFAGHWVNSLNINYQLSYFIDKLCADYRDTDRVAYTCPCMYRAVSINSNGACGPRSHTHTNTHAHRQLSSAQLPIKLASTAPEVFVRRKYLKVFRFFV